MWIGAEGGLFRYDGKNFSAFTPRPGEDSLRSSSITCILADITGDLWIGTDGGGLALLHSADGNFSPIFLALPGGEEAKAISALASDGAGSLFVGTAEGSILRLGYGNGIGDDSTKDEAREPHLDIILPPGGAAITSLLMDSRQRLWAGTDGAGLVQMDRQGKIVETHRHDALTPDSPGSSRISALLEDSLGFIWIGLKEGGVDLLAGPGFRHSLKPETGAFPPVSALVEDPKGRIWMGFAGGGTGILDPSDMSVELQAVEEEATVTALGKDRRGLLWVGLDRGGLRTGDLRSVSFERFRQTVNGKPLGTILGLAEQQDGSIIAASRTGGLLGYDPLKEALVPLATLPSGNRLPPAGRILVSGSSRGVFLGGPGGMLEEFHADGSRTRLKLRDRLTEAPIQDDMLCIMDTQDGMLHAGTRNGLLVIKDRSEVVARELPGKTVTSLRQDAAGRIWIGTSDAGLFFLPRSGGPAQPAGRGGRGRDGIGDLRIETLFLDSRGQLWIGTGGAGLVLLDPDTGVVRRRGRDFGILLDSVRGIAEDSAGILWIAGPEGLYSLDSARGDSFRFGTEDGLCEGSMDEGALLFSSQGELWVGSSGGLTRFDPSAVPRYTSSPEVSIYDLKDPSGEPLVRGGRETGIILPWDNGGLRFGIAATDYLAPDRNRYAMKLEDRQAAWTDMGSANVGYLAPLSPGRYMLRVKAANGNGVWNDYGASLAIDVEHPWWDSLWFRSLAAGAILLVLGGLIAARIGSLRKRNALLVKFARHIGEAREEERKIAARDVHDEIGQHLMVLNFHAYWLSSHPSAGEGERASVIGEMQQAIKEAMASVKAVAARLRPAALDTLDFPDALRWYVRSFGKMSGMKTSLDIGPGWETMEKEDAATFFQVLQEMLSNVARHSVAGQVRIRFSVTADGYVLETMDDGKGIDADKVDAQDSFGIIGMRERCAARGGTLSVTGAPGKGCTVTARIGKKK
jgi:signal transduction histidine kinase/ligand-binding sensor domain-containing protein